MSTPPGTSNKRPSTSLRSVPPTLQPFLDNLPHPTSLDTDARTPPRILTDRFDHDERTPRQTYFPITKDDDEDGDEETDEPESQQKEDDPGDDGEFESHYSHQSPSIGSDSEDVDAVVDAGPSEQKLASRTEDVTVQPVERVNSLPATAPRTSSDLPKLSILHTSRSTTALSHASPIPSHLAPPFYNKPPAPYPPSPSLTSLIPLTSLLNRSTTSTRPTTPDSSDVETPNDTEAAVAHSARRAKPLPPTSPKVPTYEYYGFVLYLASSLAFLMYILWSYLPSPFLHALGITYYPNRWWALAIPGWIVMALCYVYVALACWNVEYLTLGLGHVECMVDEAGSVAVLDGDGNLRRGGSKRWESELEERRREEQRRLVKSGGKGSGRKRREERKDREDEWYGYTGEITDTGVASGLSWSQIWNRGTDGVMDVPLGGVCEVLYGEGRDRF